ncbi:MAG: DUF2231 domain-containing protein, partial [Pirellula staleyi]
RDIAPLLQDKCLSCHEGDKAKGGFVISDRDAVLGFVEPGDAAASSLWTDYLIQPSKDALQDSLVMPPDGPLDSSQLATIKLWIDEGADWPEGETIGLRKVELDPSELDRPLSMSTKIYRAIGYFHPAMVHFPITLYFLSGVCAFLSYFLGPKCRTTAFQCLVLAALTSVVTVIMGWSFADTQGYAEWSKGLAANATHDEQNFFWHRWLGTGTAFLGILTVAMGLIASRTKSNRLNHGWRIGAIVLAGLVGLVGHQGGELVYGDIFDKALEQLRK